MCVFNLEFRKLELVILGKQFLFRLSQSQVFEDVGSRLLSKGGKELVDVLLHSVLIQLAALGLLLELGLHLFKNERVVLSNVGSVVFKFATALV